MVVKEDTCICMIISMNRTTRMVSCYTCLRTCFMPKATCSEKPQLNLSFVISGTKLLVFTFWSSALMDSLSSTHGNQAPSKSGTHTSKQIGTTMNNTPYKIKQCTKRELDATVIRSLETPITELSLLRTHLSRLTT
jgi:hypothetical protein